ncbi:MAG: helix-turn-helix transcriptional regulator [Gaiellaceae bacterium]
MSEEQLTLDDWAHTLEAEREKPVPPPPFAPPAASEAAAIAEVIAARLAQELAVQVPASPGEPPPSRLLTLDELVAELPPAKKPQTWKRWLYERTRRGEVPGCVKLGGMLFFQREPALAWLHAGAASSK